MFVRHPSLLHQPSHILCNTSHTISDCIRYGTVYSIIRELYLLRLCRDRTRALFLVLLVVWVDFLSSTRPDIPRHPKTVSDYDYHCDPLCLYFFSKHSFLRERTFFAIISGSYISVDEYRGTTFAPTRHETMR